MEKSLSLLPALFIAVICMISSCQKEEAPPSPPKSNQKEILSFNIDNCCYAFDEYYVKIDVNNRIVYAGIDNRRDITKLKPTITIPAGAAIQPKSGAEVNFSSPVTYVVTAENGTSVQYKVIISQVWGGVTYDEPGEVTIVSKAENLHHSPFFREGECCLDNRKGVQISLGHTDDWIVLTLMNKTLSQTLIGSYNINSSCTKGCAASVYRDNNSEKIVSSPISGKIIITYYNQSQKRISGRYEDVKFKYGDNEYFIYSGEFKNVPLL